MTALATLGRGFDEPAHAAQQVFRALLEAMSRPGRIQTLPADVLDDIEPPGLGRGLTALLLTLLDAETSAWLGAPLASRAAADYLRFHTGVRMHDTPDTAAFAVVGALSAQPDLWSRLMRGSDAAPQEGATLIVELPALHDGTAAPLALRGPGIADVHRLSAGGLDPRFWTARESLQNEYPRGVELILVCGDRIAALPRTSRVTLEG